MNSVRHLVLFTAFCCALLYPSAKGAESGSFEEVLINHNWTWVVLYPHPDPWDERRFAKDGTATAWRRGELMCSGTWKITGPREVTIQNLSTQKNVHILTFSADLKEFKATDSKRKNNYRGERLDTKSPGAPPLPTIQTDANQPRIEVIKDQGPNATEWALTPLDEAIPSDIRQNLTFLREDLLDEGKKAAKSTPEAYKLASDYCDKLLAALDQRELARVNAGYRAAQVDANKATSTQALDARRNHEMSWPQYAREESQRAALRENETNKADVKKERLKVEWATRATQMRSYLDNLYRQLREAMRQPPQIK